MGPDVTRRRFALGAAVLPLALLVTDAAVSERPEPAPRARPDWRERLRPEIVERGEWGARESLRDEPVRYTGEARAIFVHHTAHPDDYDCSNAPELLRGMYTYHVTQQGWDDVGYNFLVDKCGRIYEGRAGGVDRNVYGAHTTGFNRDTVGIAVVGTFGAAEPPERVLDALARITAWKLRPKADPTGRVRLRSTNDGSRFPKGEAVRLDVVSGHRDTYRTDCPGEALYEALPKVREKAARLRADAREAARAAYEREAEGTEGGDGVERG